MHGLSLAGAGGGCSSLGCVGFSSRWLLLLQGTGLVAPCHVESSWTRNWACVPALAGRFLTTGPPGTLQYHPLVFIIVSLQFVSLWPLCRLSSSCFSSCIFLPAVVPSYLFRSAPKWEGCFQIPFAFCLQEAIPIATALGLFHIFWYICLVLCIFFLNSTWGIWAQDSPTVFIAYLTPTKSRSIIVGA